MRSKTARVPDRLMPALCLDLDGTVRTSASGVEFIDGPDDVVLFDDVEEKIWEYRNKGFLIFGISNQAGVAFGYKTPADIQAELDSTLALFERDPFHIVKACYHHQGGDVEPYCHRSLLRKPDVGMLALCEVDAWNAGYIVDWGESLFVGDRPEDRECAGRAGIKFVWAWKFFGRTPPLTAGGDVEAIQGRPDSRGG